jgi:hypothetical protein
VVKFRRELLRLEQLGLLVGEARVLVSGRPLRKNHGESAPPLSQTQIRRPRITTERQNASYIDRGDEWAAYPEEAARHLREADAAAAAGGRRRRGLQGCRG